MRLRAATNCSLGLTLQFQTNSYRGADYIM